MMTAMQPFNLPEIDRLLTTTKAVRRRLDLTRPVPRDVLVECIRLACYAPNASNGQEWRWVVLDDREQIRRAGELYRDILVPRVSTMLETKLADGDEAGARISRSILYLADKMPEVPVIVIPCYDRSLKRERYSRLLQEEITMSPEMNSASYGSIYPAVWSFQLALRSRGLGSAFTTAHQFDQPGMAKILGIPEAWDQSCLIPVGYTTGDDFSPSPRGSVEDVIVWNHGRSGPSS
jgi:nitroreductase